MYTSMQSMSNRAEQWCAVKKDCISEMSIKGGFTVNSCIFQIITKVTNTN